MEAAEHAPDQPAGTSQLGLPVDGARYRQDHNDDEVLDQHHLMRTSTSTA
jgi:hypothetical protein